MHTTRPRPLLAAAGAAAATIATALAGAAPATAAPPVANIVGGDPATQPYAAMVSVQARFGGRTSHSCGGTLIDPEWVVTAAHCVLDENVQVRIGSLRTDRGGQVRAIARQVAHRPTPDGAADIALIRLSRPSTARPAPIGVVPATRPVPVRLVGWGAQGPDVDGPKALRQVDSTILSGARCDGVGAGDLCVDDPARPVTSACFGDSGGPAFVRQGGRWAVVGATSRYGGTNGPICVGSTIYTSVPAFRAWIERTIGHELP